MASSIGCVHAQRIVRSETSPYNLIGRLINDFRLAVFLNETYYPLTERIKSFC